MNAESALGCLLQSFRRDKKYELAVLCTDGEGLRITYDTPITDDVIGWLTPERVSELMAQVAALPLCKAD